MKNKMVKRIIVFVLGFVLMGTMAVSQKGITYGEGVPVEEENTVIKVVPTQTKEVTPKFIIENWIKKYSKSKAWEGFEAFEKEEALAKETLFRLLITYYLDAEPRFTLKSLVSLEPRIVAYKEGGQWFWACSTSLMKGDIFLLIDAQTGEVIQAQTNEGGNG